MNVNYSELQEVVMVKSLDLFTSILLSLSFHKWCAFSAMWRRGSQVRWMAALTAHSRREAYVFVILATKIYVNYIFISFWGVTSIKYQSQMQSIDV